MPPTSPTAPAAPPGSVRITRLKIEKFRAIASAEIELGDTVALVGQNGSGKSSILRALNAFFNFDDEKADFENGSHAYSRTMQSVIEVTIEGLASDPALPRTQAGSSQVRAQLKFRRQAVWNVLVGGKWQSAAPGFHEALRKQVAYALIPTRRDHAVAHEPATGLLERAVDEWVTSNRQRDRVSPQVAKLGGQLQKNSLSGFEKQLRKVAPSDGPFSFELSYSAQPDYKLLLANLALSVNEGGQSIPLADSGSGTQSMAIFALYAYLAELQSKTFVLGMEEPEQNLHPQAQRQLINRIMSLDLQVLFTTHSPTVVDSLNHEQVVLCRRTTGKNRGLEAQIRQIPSDFFTRHKLDRDSYYKFHRRRNSEFIFADFVTVTESPIDSVVVLALLQEAGADPAELSMSVVALDGVDQIPHMFHILHELGIASAFVVDKDYFLPYKNGERKVSLDSKGYPQYKAEAKVDSLLSTLFPKASDYSKVVAQLAGNHQQAMASLREVGFFCFRYAMEIDLVVAQETRNRLFDRLNVPEADRTERHLLTAKAKAIKRQEALLPVLAGLKSTNLPYSYKALRSELPKMAKAARQRP